MRHWRLSASLLLLTTPVIGAGCHAPAPMQIEPIPDTVLARLQPEADADSALARGDRRLLVAFFGWGPEVPDWGRRQVDAWPKAYGRRYVLAEGDMIPERTPAEAEAHRKRMDAIRGYIIRYDTHLRAALHLVPAA